MEVETTQLYRTYDDQLRAKAWRQHFSGRRGCIRKNECERVGAPARWIKVSTLRMCGRVTSPRSSGASYSGGSFTLDLGQTGQAHPSESQRSYGRQHCVTDKLSLRSIPKPSLQLPPDDISCEFPCLVSLPTGHLNRCVEKTCAGRPREESDENVHF